MPFTYTIYWDESQGMHHLIFSQVEESGNHKVVQSLISNNAGQTLTSLYAHCAKHVGEANVRAYTITK